MVYLKIKVADSNILSKTGCDVSVRSLAGQCDIIITMLPATQHVVDVFRGVFSYKYHAVYMLTYTLITTAFVTVCMHVCTYV